MLRSASFDPRRPARPHSGAAWFDGRLARDLVEVSDDPAVLEAGGWWAVRIDFEGRCRFWRFDRVERAPLPTGGAWVGPPAGAWRSSLDRAAYQAGVHEIRRRIRAGEVYQVNLCRVLRAPLPPEPARTAEPGSAWALAGRLAAGNPAPYAGVIDVHHQDLNFSTTIVSASPELYLERDGDRLRSAPIKGTGRTSADLLPKDEAENVMIVDLVRNDLQRVGRPGTVSVPSLLAVEPHPGLVHLVSTVETRLRPGVGWPGIVEATFPPGSVSGAPKSSALRTIADLEPVPRGPYCGAIGYVDADAGRARLAVGIRTFWVDGEDLCFGTGAGITWDSDPEREWAETELKAARLISLASRSAPVSAPGLAADLTADLDLDPDQVSSRATAASRSR